MANDGPGSQPGHRVFDQPRAVWATAFAATVGFMSIGLVDPILTSIAAGLNASPAQVSLLFTSYFFVTSSMMLVTGWVSSRLGSRATLLVGAALIVFFSALAGISASVTELVLFRAGWGLGNAFFVVTALSVLVAVTRGGTGRAVLFYEAAIGLGMSGGPLLGALLGSWSWRWPFFGTATLMAIGLVSIALFLPRLPRPTQRIALSAPLVALRHPGLLTVATGAFFYYYAFFTVLAFAPFVLNMSPSAVGGVFCGWGLLLAVFSVLVAPRVEARFGLVPVMTVCLVLMAALLVVMGYASPTVVAGCVILTGALMGVCNTLFTELALEISDAPRPVASAGYNFLRWFAGVIAPFASPKIAEAMGVEAAFAVAAAAALVGPVILFLRRHALHKPVRHAAPLPQSSARPVLAAIDGSASDRRVLDRAISLARAAGASVVSVHVSVVEVFPDEAAELEDADVADGIVAAAAEYVAAAGVGAGSEVLRASPGAAARDVVTFAKEVSASSIVVGASHRHDLGDVIHGSFSRALASIRPSDLELVVVPEPASSQGAVKELV